MEPCVNPVIKEPSDSFVQRQRRDELGAFVKEREDKCFAVSLALTTGDKFM